MARAKTTKKSPKKPPTGPATGTHRPASFAKWEEILQGSVSPVGIDMTSRCGGSICPTVTSAARDAAREHRFTANKAIDDMAQLPKDDFDFDVSTSGAMLALERVTFESDDARDEAEKTLSAWVDEVKKEARSVIESARESIIEKAVEQMRTQAGPVLANLCVELETSIVRQLDAEAALESLERRVA